ncbi:hypothetical protein [Lacipirellula parvula]|uniref:Uncharacterized protein n=1 Tax=Lacipirellula parvula TaxID=2650471 RepID=A0A5K7XJK1_9BACT|nr:hypothetical protein [Lacipirellula parvula]BBO34576.1 hypothetical protein PLANPX_4188 [Lacipirellula parvula]
MTDYARGTDGRWLSSAERVQRYQAQNRSQPAKVTEPLRKLSSEQISEAQEAKRQGKAEAAEKFREPQSPNPWERQRRQLEKTAATPRDFAQLKRFERHAAQWERDNADRLQREAVAETRRSDPAYKNAVEHSDAFLRTIAPDFLAAASNARGYLEASGDFDGYWAKVSAIESEVWSREDAKTSELALKASASMTEFKEQCDRSNEAAARLRTAQSLTGESE